MLEEIFEDNLIGDPNDLEEIIEQQAEEEEDDPQAQDEENEAGNNENNENNTGTGGTQEEPKKKRVVKNPQPKLNPERLKGPRGIAVLEETFKDFEYLGKGHERTDLNRVMKRLEHWAHRLFPRFQFDDCLEKIEKLGQKKPVQVYVKRIRMGLETGEEPVLLQEDDDDDDDPLQNAADQPIDAFDELLRDQLSELQARRETPVPSAPPTPVQPVLPPPPQQTSVLSAEQRERMLRNRMLAEERRLARMKAKREMEKANEEDSPSLPDVSAINADASNQICDISIPQCSEDHFEKMGISSSHKQIGIASNKVSNIVDLSVEKELHNTSPPPVKNVDIASKAEITSTAAESIGNVTLPMLGIVNINDSTQNSNDSKESSSASASEDNQLNKIKCMAANNEQNITNENNSSSMLNEVKQINYTSKTVDSEQSAKADAEQEHVPSMTVEAEQNSSVSTIINDEQLNRPSMIMDAEESNAVCTTVEQNYSVSMTVDAEENNFAMVTDAEQNNPANMSTDDEQSNPTAMSVDVGQNANSMSTDDEQSNPTAMSVDDEQGSSIGNDQTMPDDNEQNEASNDNPVLEIIEES